MLDSDRLLVAPHIVEEIQHDLDSFVPDEPVVPLVSE